MKLGFLTVCLAGIPLADLVKWASGQGFQALEVGAWPLDSSRDYQATSIDVARLDERRADEIKKLFLDHGITISALTYCENNLDADPVRRKAYHDHLRKVIDSAGLLGVDLVCTFVGRDITKSVEENLEEYAKVFPGIIGYAESRGVRLMIENCPMPGWQKRGIPGNLAYSPELWRELFKITPNETIGLNFDPSHLYWLGIDYIGLVPEFKNRIFHVHAKDTEILPDGLNDYGVFGKLLGKRVHGEGWWRYRIPGLGEIDWSSFISTLNENGYDGVVSIEHEDPVWSGSEEKVRRGLALGYKALWPFIV